MMRTFDEVTLKQKSRKLLANIHRNFVVMSVTITCRRHLWFAATREKEKPNTVVVSFRKPFPMSQRFHFLYLYKKFVFGHTKSSLNCESTYLECEGGTLNNERNEYHSSPGGVIFFCGAGGGKVFVRRENFRPKVFLKSMLIKRYFLEIPISFETLVESSRVH